MTETKQGASEARQLDFWLGDWEVTWGDDGRGTNRVVQILDGQVIQENFDAGDTMPFRGMSLSVYKTSIGAWQQTWVDTDGNYWHFTGEFKDGRMIFATEDLIDGQPVKLRMVFYNIEPDQLKWKWEQSRDGGQTWELNWNIHYKRKTTL
jgi:hypothetical protein